MLYKKNRVSFYMYELILTQRVCRTLLDNINIRACFTSVRTILLDVILISSEAVAHLLCKVMFVCLFINIALQLI